MLLESMPTSATTTVTRAGRALPQVPPRLDLPPSIIESYNMVDDGHYNDIHSIFVGYSNDNNRGAQSSVEDYTDARTVVVGLGGDDRTAAYWRPPSSDDPYHYIDIDRLTNQSDSGGQIVSHHGYEGLDPALRALRRSQRLHDYARLGAGEAADAAEAGSAHAAAEHTETAELDASNESQNTVSQSL